MYKIENDTIRFSHNYDEPLSKNLLEIIRLNNINQLVFGMNFNQSLENLPSCITPFYISNADFYKYKIFIKIT